MVQLGGTLRRSGFPPQTTSGKQYHALLRKEVARTERNPQEVWGVCEFADRQPKSANELHEGAQWYNELYGAGWLTAIYLRRSPIALS